MIKKLLCGSAQTLLLDWTNVVNLTNFLTTDEGAIPITVDGEEMLVSPLVAKWEIYFNLFDEDGQAVTDAAGNPIKAIKFDFDTDKNQFSKSITINESTPNQYVRLYVYSSDVDIADGAQPEDYKLEKLEVAAMGTELVPVSYFIDFILSPETKLDPAYAEAVASYAKNNRPGIKSFLRSAESRLESKTKLFFQERIITEQRDYFFDQYTIHLWQFVVGSPPINAITDYKLQFANQQIADINPKLCTYDRMMGIIEFLPYPAGESLALYSMLLTNMSAMAVTVLNDSALSRIPNMFVCSYRTGLVFPGCDEGEKESIRQAICKKAFKASIPIIDPGIRQTSRTEGIDGTSSSRNYGGYDKLLERIDKEEDEFVFDLMKKYGKLAEMVVV
jgi:hypothetical protein